MAQPLRVEARREHPTCDEKPIRLAGGVVVLNLLLLAAAAVTVLPFAGAHATFSRF